RVDLAVHVELPDATGDELRVLGPEIQDQDHNELGARPVLARLAPRCALPMPPDPVDHDARLAARGLHPPTEWRTSLARLAPRGALPMPPDPVGHDARLAARGLPVDLRHPVEQLALRGLLQAVIRGLVRDVDVVDVALAEAGGGDAHEDGALNQLREAAGAEVAHARAQAADELLHDERQRALVRHPALDAFGHELHAELGAVL